MIFTFDFSQDHTRPIVLTLFNGLGLDRLRKTFFPICNTSRPHCQETSTKHTSQCISWKRPIICLFFQLEDWYVLSF